MYTGPNGLINRLTSGEKEQIIDIKGRRGPGRAVWARTVEAVFPVGSGVHPEPKVVSPVIAVLGAGGVGPWERDVRYLVPGSGR